MCNFLIWDIVQKYHLPVTKLIARGSQGAIYDSKSDGFVVKIISNLPDFIPEVTASARLNHYAILKPIGWSYNDITHEYYLILPKGIPIILALFNGLISLEKTVLDILSAVVHANQRKITHNDIHHTNMIYHNGHAKLIDFGYSSYDNGNGFYDIRRCIQSIRDFVHEKSKELLAALDWLDHHSDDHKSLPEFINNLQTHPFWKNCSIQTDYQPKQRKFPQLILDCKIQQSYLYSFDSDLFNKLLFTVLMRAQFRVCDILLFSRKQIEHAVFLIITQRVPYGKMEKIDKNAILFVLKITDCNVFLN
jgi:hypothetical protein